MSAARRLPLRGGWCAALALALSCAPRVVRFDAIPRHICPGQQVALSWRVVGSASIAADPPVPGLPEGPVADEGQATIAPSAKTDVKLRVTRLLGKPTTSIQQIEVTGIDPRTETLVAGMADPAATPGCNDGWLWATIHAQRFATGLVVAIVHSYPGDGRTYVVRHAGVEATIGPRIETAAFAGLPIAGDWDLISPLTPGETCGTPTLPHNVAVQVVTHCMRGGER